MFNWLKNLSENFSPDDNTKKKQNVLSVIPKENMLVPSKFLVNSLSGVFPFLISKLFNDLKSRYKITVLFNLLYIKSSWLLSHRFRMKRECMVFFVLRCSKTRHNATTLTPDVLSSRFFSTEFFWLLLFLH